MAKTRKREPHCFSQSCDATCVTPKRNQVKRAKRYSNKVDRQYLKKDLEKRVDEY